MSSTRPYLVTIGAAEYMIEATDRAQAMRIALSGYPMPFAKAKPANTADILAWTRSEKPIYQKGNFVANTPATIVLYCDDEGRLAAEEDFRIEPGNFHLHVERIREPSTLEQQIIDAGEGVAYKLQTPAETPADVLDEIHDDGLAVLADAVATEVLNEKPKP